MAWAAHQQTQVAKTTMNRYLGSLRQCQAFLIESAIDEIDSKTLGTLVQARQRDGVTPATIKRDLVAISSVLHYAWSQDWREGNPALDRMGFLKERRDPIYLPTEAAYDAVLAVAPAEYRALLQAARLTGCRQTELTTLTWDRVGTDGTVEIVGKGNKRRTIRLSKAARALFKTRGVGLVFPRADGKAWRADWDHRRFMAMAMRHNPELRRFRYHDLRHWYAVETLKRGEMGIYALSKHLGHSSVMVTERSYLAFLTPDEAEKAKQ